MSDEEEYASNEEMGEEEAGEEEMGEEEQDENEEEQQEEVEEEEKEPDDPPNPVTLDMLRENGVQGQLTRIGPGMSYAYTRMDLVEREITDIEQLSKHIHIRHLNLSANYIKDIKPLVSMKNLLTLTVVNNKIAEVPLEPLQYIQKLTFNENRLKTLDGLVCHPQLVDLAAEYNQIERLSIPNPDILSNLRILDLRGNKLTTTAGVYPPNLEELYLASNLITEIGRMEGLKKLRKLHLRENQITSLASFQPIDVPNLTYLNLRGNLIEEVSEIKVLKGCEKLAEITFQDTPLSEIDDYRIEVWATLDVPITLVRLDKDMLEPDEQEEAQELVEKHKEEEAEALAAAQEEALKKQEEQEEEQEGAPQEEE